MMILHISNDFFCGIFIFYGHKPQRIQLNILRMDKGNQGYRHSAGQDALQAKYGTYRRNCSL